MQFEILLKSTLLVHWRANKKTWITCEMFQNWFYNCFALEVKNYLQRKNISIKGHPINLNHPNV